MLLELEVDGEDVFLCLNYFGWYIKWVFEVYIEIWYDKDDYNNY